MIDQIPRTIHGVSLERTRTLKTSLGVVEIHHIRDELFTGFDGLSPTEAGVASPEKALFDTAYLLSTRSGGWSLPEVELPDNFNSTKLCTFLDLVLSKRVRRIMHDGLGLVLRESAASKG